MATTTRAKNPAPEPTTEVEAYDFDNWTPEAEDAALRALNDVKYIIVERSFVGRFADGTIVKIPLTLTTRMIDELQSEHDTPVAQFRHLLMTFAGQEVADSIEDQGIIPLAIITEKFFRALQRAQELAFPES